MENLTQHSEKAVELIMIYGPKLLLAIVTLVIGWGLINSLGRIFSKSLARKQVDKSLQGFFVSLGTTLLKVMLVISVAGMIGIEMTSFIAVLGAAGLAVGMALSGTLQNFAGGVIVLLFRPFRVGDFIEAQGFSGTVKDIQIFTTVLQTPDNKIIILPNAPLSSGSIVNYSAQPTRRVDFTFGIGYNDDIDKAKLVVRSIVANDARINKDPEPFVAVSELGDNSVNLVTRVWVDASNYWPVFFDTLETVKKEFDRQNISIPYPQRDIHVYQHGEMLKEAANI